MARSSRPRRSAGARKPIGARRPPTAAGRSSAASRSSADGRTRGAAGGKSSTSARTRGIAGGKSSSAGRTRGIAGGKSSAGRTRGIVGGKSSADGESTAAAPSYGRALVKSQLARVRALCGTLPDVTERPSHGSPAFMVNDKRAFAYFLDNHHSDGRLALWCAAPEGAQAMLVDSNPDHYFLPPYVAHHGWIGVRLDRDTPWSEIAAVLEAAHQTREKPPRASKAAKRDR